MAKLSAAQLRKLRSMQRSFCAEHPSTTMTALYRGGYVAKLEYSGGYVLTSKGSRAAQKEPQETP